jgi:hypothetical protein
MSRFQGLAGRLKETIKVRGLDGSEQEVVLKFTKVEYFAELVPFMTRAKKVKPENAKPESAEQGSVDEVDLGLSKEEVKSMGVVLRAMLRDSEPDLGDDDANVLIMMNLPAFTEGFTKVVKRATEFFSSNTELKKKVEEQLAKVQ